MVKSELVDSFDYTHYVSAKVPDNIKHAKDWDIEEYNSKMESGYTIGLDPWVTLYPMRVIRNFLTWKNYITQKKSKMSREYLFYIDQYIHALKKEMNKYLSSGNPQSQRIVGNSQSQRIVGNSIINLYTALNVFVTTPHVIQEITPNTQFEGINKPKDVVHVKNMQGFKRDNTLRAGSRHIMLTISTEKGNPRSWNFVKKLLLHELAHTMCNHITYRTDENHEDDFYWCEDFITQLGNKTKECIEIENEIKTRIF